MKRVFKIKSQEIRQNAANAVMAIKGDDAMQVTIEPCIDDHTAEQRGFFHVLCREISQNTGYTQGEVKELIKMEIFGTKIVEFAGRTREVVSSSEYHDDGTKRVKPSYSELIEGAYRIAAEGGIQLPNARYNG